MNRPRPTSAGMNGGCAILLARGIGWDSPVYRRVLERFAARAVSAAPTITSAVLEPRHWEILAGRLPDDDR